MQIIDGKALSAKYREKLKSEIQSLKSRGVTPGLAVILVGDDPGSQVYVRNKIKAAEYVGIKSLRGTRNNRFRMPLSRGYRRENRYRKNRGTQRESRLRRHTRSVASSPSSRRTENFVLYRRKERRRRFFGVSDGAYVSRHARFIALHAARRYRTDKIDGRRNRGKERRRDRKKQYRR